MGERGAVTIWGIGLILVLFGVAGLAIDTWRVFAERQALAGLADSASIAGATAVDVVEFRDSGTVQLDQGLAAARASAYLNEHAPDLDDDIAAAITFPANGIEVTLTREVELTIIGAFLEEGVVGMEVSAYSTPGERVGP
jgi:uncharacterized membrane protein